MVVRNLKKKRLLFTTDISSSIKKSDIIFICVGTPTKNNKADLKYVFNVIKSIKSNLNRYKIIGVGFKNMGIFNKPRTMLFLLLKGVNTNVISSVQKKIKL